MCKKNMRLVKKNRSKYVLRVSVVSDLANHRITEHSVTERVGT